MIPAWNSPTGPPNCTCQTSLDAFGTAGTTQGVELNVPDPGALVTVPLSGLNNLAQGTTVTFRLFCYGIAQVPYTISIRIRLSGVCKIDTVVITIAN